MAAVRCGPGSDGRRVLRLGLSRHDLMLLHFRGAGGGERRRNKMAAVFTSGLIGGRSVGGHVRPTEVERGGHRGRRAVSRLKADPGRRVDQRKLLTGSRKRAEMVRVRVEVGVVGADAAVVLGRLVGREGRIAGVAGRVSAVDVVVVGAQ